jgi:hypothetical protein
VPRKEDGQQEWARRTSCVSCVIVRAAQAEGSRTQRLAAARPCSGGSAEAQHALTGLGSCSAAERRWRRGFVRIGTGGVKRWPDRSFHCDCLQQRIACRMHLRYLCDRGGWMNPAPTRFCMRVVQTQCQCLDERPWRRQRAAMVNW